jgi:hypothetical protein
LSPPYVAETDEKEREKPAHEVVRLLKLADLKGLLLLNPGVNLFFLNKNPMAIETDGLLIRSAQIKPVRGAPTHGATAQKTFRPTVPRYPDQ